MDARARALGRSTRFVVALLLVGAACGHDPGSGPRGDGGDATAGPSASPTTSAPAASDPPTSTTRGPLASGAAVTLAFAGDVHFEGEARAALDGRGDRMLDAIAPVLGAADLSIVNLETAITERGTPQPKEYTFRAPARALDALRAAGVDAVSIANNHGLDFGDEGFDDTLAAEQRSGLPILGIGRTGREAYAPEVFRVRGQRVAVIAATQVLDGALEADWSAIDDHRGLASAKAVDRLVAEVRRTRPKVDTLVVFLHWGTERETCPQERQRSLAAALVAAGADVVVGSHAHRLQGAGRLGDAYVAYGLGNFVFYSDSGPATETGVLTVTVTGRRVDDAVWTPARITAGVPVPLVGAEATEAQQRWQALRACTDLS